jgi:GNAT superfamily N-acetyltransferase
LQPADQGQQGTHPTNRVGVGDEIGEPNSADAGGIVEALETTSDRRPIEVTATGRSRRFTQRFPSSSSQLAPQYSGHVVTVRLANIDDVPQMARAQMRAFADDPLITWMLPPDDFERRAILLFDCMLRASMVHDTTYTTDDGVCTAVWAPPGRWSFTTEQTEIMAGPFAEAAGDRVDRGLGALIELAGVHPSEPHWYLEGLGTHPDWQRLGLASAVLAPILNRCDSDQLPAYLETQRETNVPFYQRHGFRVIGTHQLANGGPKMWLMWRTS